MKLQKLIFTISFCAGMVLRAVAQLPEANSLSMPVAGNSYQTNGQVQVTNNGIQNWSSPADEFTSYIRVASAGNLKVWLNYTQGSGKIMLTIAKKSVELSLDGTQSEKFAGEWQIKDTGYVAIRVKGLNKTGDVFAKLSGYQLSGTALKGKTAFVKNNEGNFYYWGRRGPSVHLSYPLPKDMDQAEWFYNEVTVPKGEDIIGSYYMANGFGEGYFGIQVNSATERRVLFSVWSPFNTDDPKSIPESHKIKLLKKGEQVHSGEFGNEGSGGQSYLKYNWVAGNTYRFLLHASPDGENNTVYTAYFFAPELNKWQLMASFKRPQTSTYLKRLHSFLENFIPEQGYRTRKVLFNNQWVCDRKGKWAELNRAQFTTDNTGKMGYRMDYAGGLDKGGFYLQNCGFFSAYTQPLSIFERPLNNQKPEIDFNKLP